MRRPSLREGLLFGLACVPVGLAVGGWVSATALGEGWGTFFIHAAFGAFSAGALAWWAVAARDGRLTALRSALAGGVAGLLGHPLTWLTVIPVHGRQLHGPDAALGVGAFSLMSMLLFGPLTVPAGAVMGILFARSRLARWRPVPHRAYGRSP